MKLHPALQIALLPLSWIYGAVVVARAWLYRVGVLRQRRLHGVVISVGNLTVGGTGKTPMVIWLAQRLLTEGKKVGILTRGYRGPAGESSGASRLPEDPTMSPPPEMPLGIFSDEVWLLWRRVGNSARLGVGPNRHFWGRELEKQGTDWFVLDDGFQHLKLARTADIVLIDATEPFSGNRMLPSGTLREPPSTLSRADVVVITRVTQAPALEATVRRISPAPIFYAETHLDGVFQAQSHILGPQKADWRNRRFFAFCGIGNAPPFLVDLRRWGIDVADSMTFRDHHWYSQDDAREIQRKAQACGAQALICTEKDVFNLRRVQFNDLPLFYCRISLNLTDPDRFWQTLHQVIERRRAERR